MTKNQSNDDDFFEKMKNVITSLNSLKKDILRNQLIHAFDDFDKISYEAFVKITKFQKDLYLLQINKSHSINNDLNFFRVHAYIINAHYDVEKNDLFDEEFVFDDIYLKINLAKSFKNLSHMFDVSFTRFATDQNIVQIALYEIVDVISKNVVHVMLIIDRVVDKIKKQDFVFVYAQKNDERNEIFAI